MLAGLIKPASAAPSQGTRAYVPEPERPTHAGTGRLPRTRHWPGRARPGRSRHPPAQYPRRPDRSDAKDGDAHPRQQRAGGRVRRAAAGHGRQRRHRDHPGRLGGGHDAREHHRRGQPGGRTGREPGTRPWNQTQRGVEGAGAVAGGRAAAGGDCAGRIHHRLAKAATAQEALAAGMVDFLAQDVPDLLRQLDGYPVHVGDRTRTLHTAGLEVVDVGHEPAGDRSRPADEPERGLSAADAGGPGGADRAVQPGRLGGGIYRGGGAGAGLLRAGRAAGQLFWPGVYRAGICAVYPGDACATTARWRRPAPRR